jgi:hypothetical protein
MAKKARSELRVDADVHVKAKEIAAAAGISMNQFFEGVIAWAVNQAHPGRPELNPDASITTTEEEGVLWFGDSADGETGRDHLIFVLDFSATRAIVHGLEVYSKSAKEGE